MVKETKDTTPGETGQKPKAKSAASPVTVALRPMTEDELQVLKQELRNKVEARGEERDPTEDEVQEVRTRASRPRSQASAPRGSCGGLAACGRGTQC